MKVTEFIQKTIFYVDLIKKQRYLNLPCGVSKKSEPFRIEERR